jgi:hypothetical protein
MVHTKTKTKLVSFLLVPKLFYMALSLQKTFWVLLMFVSEALNVRVLSTSTES